MNLPKDPKDLSRSLFAQPIRREVKFKLWNGVVMPLKPKCFDTLQTTKLLNGS